MKHISIAAIVIAVAFIANGCGSAIGDKLSTDALGMAVGLVFGVIATIPAALLVLAASRREPAPLPPLPPPRYILMQPSTALDVSRETLPARPKGEQHDVSGLLPR